MQSNLSRKPESLSDSDQKLRSLSAVICLLKHSRYVSPVIPCSLELESAQSGHFSRISSARCGFASSTAALSCDLSRRSGHSSDCIARSSGPLARDLKIDSRPVTSSKLDFPVTRRACPSPPSSKCFVRSVRVSIPSLRATAKRNPISSWTTLPPPRAFQPRLPSATATVPLVIPLSSRQRIPPHLPTTPRFDQRISTT